MNSEIGHESYKALGYLQATLEKDNHPEQLPPSILDKDKVTDKMLIDWINRMTEELDTSRYYFSMEIHLSDDRFEHTRVYFREKNHKVLHSYCFKNERNWFEMDGDEASFRDLEQDILNGKYK